MTLATPSSLIEASAVPAESMSSEDPAQGDDLVEVVETQTLQLPPALSNPSLEGTGSGGWTLELYKQSCFNCTGLNPEGEKRWQKMRCRSDLGNDNCPVGQITIVLVGVRKQLLRQVLAAKNTGRPLDLIEALDNLRQKANEADQTWVMEQAGLLARDEQVPPVANAVDGEDEGAESTLAVNVGDNGFPVAP